MANERRKGQREPISEPTDLMWERVNKAMDIAQDAQQSVENHETLCVRNQATIMARLDGIDDTIKWATRGLVAGMMILLVGIIWNALRITVS